MDRAGVATSMASITYPGIWLAEHKVSADATRGLARDCNEYGAKMMADYPGRFGIWAVLPLPDVDGSLREIEYALGTLKADGAGVLTSYGDQWIGDPAFAPVLEELNRRKAVVFTHPNVPVCCTRGGSGTHRYLVPGVNNNIIEYGTDTTRAIMNLVVTKANERYPNIRFTFSHGGGTMPFLIERILGYQDLEKKLASPAPPGSRLHQLRQFFYDSANANNSVAMTALTKVVGKSQVLLGTDYPYGSNRVPPGIMAQHVNDLKGCGVFSPGEFQAVDNAFRVLPRLKS
jgi:predicted TIM-barrel fold metal-dependent hydrolase